MVTRPYGIVTSGRPTKYKTWKQQHFSRAVEAVKEGKLTVRRAAVEFDIPRSTLHDHVSGRVVVGGQCGPEKYLSDEEENELEAFLVGCASIGFAKSRSQVIEIHSPAGNVMQGPACPSHSRMVGVFSSETPKPKSLNSLTSIICEDGWK